MWAGRIVILWGIEMSPTPGLKQETFDDLIGKIVKAVHPRRIILFGSAAEWMARARGDLAEDPPEWARVLFPPEKPCKV